MNPHKYNIQTLERKARAVQRHIVRLNTNSLADGHIGAGLLQVELLTALHFRILNVAPDRLGDLQHDIYIQSKGHAVGCYYCILAETGFFLIEWLEAYQHTNSHPPDHPVWRKTPGIELNTGALSHGLPIVVGLILAAKKGNSTRHIFLITDDDELAEGNDWKAILAAAHCGLDNLIIISNKNNPQPAGPTRKIMNTDSLADKQRAFGMEVSECQGNDMTPVVAIIEGLQQDGKPNVIIVNTTKGAGTSFIQGCPEWHHRVPEGEEIALTLGELKGE